MRLPPRRFAIALATFVFAAPGAASASNGGVSPVTSGGASPTVTPPPTPPAPAPVTPPPAPTAQVTLTGKYAQAPAGAPRVIRLAVHAGNQLQNKPYRFGGGHASFRDKAYDCSGAVSYVLHAAGLLSSPLDSTGLAHWGVAGPGTWITIYANRKHAFMFVGGLRLDTSGAGAPGPRWRTVPRSLRGFVVRHPVGL